MNPKELIAVFGKGCKNCEYKYDCPDAFTELSHSCGAYREDQKEEKLMDKRKCESCIHAKPYGGANDNRCGAWECEYINREEAVEIWRANNDIVRCKDCKHYDTESRTFPCCTDIFGAVRYMEADGFCSKGERKGE